MKKKKFSKIDLQFSLFRFVRHEWHFTFEHVIESANKSKNSVSFLLSADTERASDSFNSSIIPSKRYCHKNIFCYLSMAIVRFVIKSYMKCLNLSKEICDISRALCACQTLVSPKKIAQEKIEIALNFSVFLFHPVAIVFRVIRILLLCEKCHQLSASSFTGNWINNKQREMRWW